MIATARPLTSKRHRLVSVVILNYNGKAFLGQCLQSLLDQTYPEFETILVDNGSSDDSVRFVREFFPWVRVIESKINLGYAGGNNLGVEYSRGDFIAILNNDTIVDAEWLAELVKTALEDNSVGVVGSKILYAHDRSIIDAIGFSVDRYMFPRPIAQNTRNNSRYIGTKNVFAIPGCSILFSRRLVESLGLFDPEYFIYGEDLDFCWRVRLAGFSCRVNCSSIVYHFGMGDTKKWGRPEIRFLNERNTMRSLIKNYSLKTLSEVIPKYFAILMAEILYFACLQKFSLVLADLRAVIWNGANFRKTWELHEKVQSKRKVCDKKIQRIMSSFSYKIGFFKELNRFIRSNKS